MLVGRRRRRRCCLGSSPPSLTLFWLRFRLGLGVLVVFVDGVVVEALGRSRRSAALSPGALSALVAVLGARLGAWMRARSCSIVGVDTRPVDVECLADGCGWFLVSLVLCFMFAFVQVDRLAEQLGSSSADVVDAVSSYILDRGRKRCRLGLAQTSLGCVVQVVVRCGACCATVCQRPDVRGVACASVVKASEMGCRVCFCRRGLGDRSGLARGPGIYFGGRRAS